MQAIILAAGRGTRMRPLTDTIAKPLVPILGKPLISHIIDALPETIDEVIIVVGYRGDEVIAHCTKAHPRMRFVFETQEKLEGTLRALSLVRKHIRGPFLVLMADDIIDRDSLESLVEAGSPTLLTTESDHPERYGVVMTDENGIVTDFEEKPELPRSHTISTGAMHLDSRIFDYAIKPHRNGELYLSTALAELARSMPVKAVPARRWISVGSIPDIAIAESLLGETA